MKMVYIRNNVFSLNIVLHEMFILAHGFVLQSLDSDDGPMHSFPPPDGAGLLHARFFSWVPVPQLLEQWENLLHSLHCPSTGNSKVMFKN